MKVAIRVDSSPRIGSGHLARCLTLANALNGRGASICFVSREMPTHLQQQVHDNGHELALIGKAAGQPSKGDLQHSHWLEASQADDAQETARVLSDRSWDWIVVDHYALDHRWESRLRRHTGKILVIDDLADRTHDCEVLLDQNMHENLETRYDGLVPPACIKLLGPRYALLRQEFADLRPSKPRIGQAVRRVLIFLSSADPDNVTSRVLSALDRVAGPELEADIVIGASNQNATALARYCASRSGRRLHVETTRMAELLSTADLAIGGGGATSWERACLGVPSLVLGLARNQYSVARSLADHGAHIYLGSIDTLTDSALGAAIETLIDNTYLRAHLAHAAFEITDGGGVARVMRKLLCPRLVLRKAVPDDCDLLFAWRNHPDTRRFFFDQAPIELPSHRRWFANTLGDRSHEFLIGCIDNKAVGALRYDVVGDTANTSIYLDPARHGEGLGVTLLKAGNDWLKEHRQEVRRIKAEVLPANISSYHAFQTAGFHEVHRTLSLDLARRGTRAGDGSEAAAVLLTGAGGVAMPRLIDGLRAKGYRVVTADADANAAGLFLADRGYQIPLATEASFASVIRDICRKEKISALVPLVDEELLSSAQVAAELDIPLIGPLPEFTAVCLDKFALMQRLASAGIQVPETRLLSAGVSGLAFPLILKPRIGRGSRGIKVTDCEEELNAYLDSARPDPDSTLIQRYLDGTEFTVSAIVWRDGVMRAVVPKEVIDKRGVTRLAVTRKHEEIVELCHRIQESMRADGPFNVQLRLDHTGAPMPFEINPRLSTTVTLTQAAGVDEVGSLIDIALGRAGVTHQWDWREGVTLVRTSRDVFMDFSEYMDRRRQAEGLS